MFNFRWGVILGCAALVVSAVLGIFFGVQPLYIFLRALIFFGVFFGLGTGIYIVINSFFPELLLSDEKQAGDETSEQPGSRINITLGNTGEYAVPELYRNSGDSQELGNIEDLVSGAFRPRVVEEPVLSQTADLEGIDRKREEVYNNMSMESSQIASNPDSFQFDDSPPPAAALHEKPVFTPVFGDDTADLGVLPDLDSMARAFSSAYGGEAAEAHPFEEAEPARNNNKGNKPQPLQGDFDPRELAEGLRTILSKDKK